MPRLRHELLMLTENLWRFDAERRVARVATTFISAPATLAPQGPVGLASVITEVLPSGDCSFQATFVSPSNPTRVAAVHTLTTGDSEFLAKKAVVSRSY